MTHPAPFYPDIDFVIADMPQKPDRGLPCTGCGTCCQLETCEAGIIAFGTDGLCPGLIWQKGRYWCLLVKLEASAPVGKMIAEGLRVGHGCYVGCL